MSRGHIPWNCDEDVVIVQKFSKSTCLITDSSTIASTDMVKSFYVLKRQGTILLHQLFLRYYTSV